MQDQTERQVPSLVVLVERMHRHLDALAVTALSDDQLAHLVATGEWLADLTEGAQDA